MHVRLRGCMKMLWRMERRRFNHQAWTLNEHQRNAPSHSLVVSYDSPTMSSYLPNGHNALDSQWTSLHYIEPPLLVRLQLHDNSTPKWVLWVHIFMWKVCKNSSQHSLFLSNIKALSQVFMLFNYYLCYLCNKLNMQKHYN